MKLNVLIIGCCIFLSNSSISGQIKTDKFGKGITFIGKDSTYQLKVGLRIQMLFDNQWEEDENTGFYSDYTSKIFVRRSRLKFGGFVLNPKIQFKTELAFSNRDISGGNRVEFSKAANVILDASLSYNFYKNWTILFGQRKLPGNRERIISSGNLQLVDRSRLNSRYNLDRDVGFQLLHHHLISNNFLVRESLALSQGEGRNVTAGHFGGFGYTIKLELLPFGKFQNNGDYTGGALTKENTPKLAIGISYDTNTNAVRSRGRGGPFITDGSGNYFGKDLYTFFLDMILKYQGFSLLVEYAYRNTNDEIPFVIDNNGNSIGTFYTGNALNVVAGYNLPSNIEFSLRFTSNNPDVRVSKNEKEYTIGISKYIVDHNFKIQTDYTYRNISGGPDLKFWRFQTDVHF
ncbi:MAG: porin [Saprospiraceae bacterium]